MGRARGGVLPDGQVVERMLIEAAIDGLDASEDHLTERSELRQGASEPAIPRRCI